ncbi:arginine ABC transporter permease ArtQ, partial [Salmonella enterica subsp. enterica serovar Wilhelmsburg]
SQASAAPREPFTYFVAVAALYLGVPTVSLVLLRMLERRYSVGVKVAEL